jgi:hypothetical protein
MVAAAADMKAAAITDTAAKNAVARPNEEGGPYPVRPLTFLREFRLADLPWEFR